MGLNTISYEATTRLPTEFGTFAVHIYRNQQNQEVTAICAGDVEYQEDLAVRVHSACFTAEALGSLKCDCKQQLDYALQYIAKHSGIVLYLPQEGRGIGLINKIRAYALQEKGHDTIEANRLLGLPVDSRSYEDARDILNHLKVQSIRLLTNNPLKLDNLTELGVTVAGRLPVICEANKHSASYLTTKETQMGHMLAGGSKSPGKSRSQVLTLPTKSPSKRPYVHVNFAITDESAIAGDNGEQIPISCDDDWRRVHELREKYDAVAVGAKTWLYDQPQLTARAERLNRQPVKQPSRVIFSGNHECSVKQEQSPRPTYIIGQPSENISAGCRLIVSANHDLKRPLQTLDELGVKSVLVEGGSKLIASFISQQMVDLLTIYVRSVSCDDALGAALALLPELATERLQVHRYGEGVLLSLTCGDSLSDQRAEFGVSV